MRSLSFISVLILAVICCDSIICAAQAPEQPAATADFWRYEPTAKNLEKPLQEPPASVTHHRLVVGGESFSYTATAATLPIRNATTDVTEGNMFYVFYSREGVTDAAKRPLTFIFNGGPGTATVWLHMLAFGPKRVTLLPDGTAPAPPYNYQDNPNTLLDRSDLVFIDPVGTGYSRPVQPAESAKFWGMANDVASIGEFVRLFLVRYERWASPKYVMGESYGTYRAAELSSYLVDRGVALNGVILISSLFDDDSRAGDVGNVNFMPTFILTAWYHKRISADLQGLNVGQVARLAEEFASGEYMTALYKGSRLNATERNKVLADIASLTGLSKAFIENNDLRVSLQRFMTELLRDQGLVVGRLDGRVTAHASDAGAIQPAFDAAEANVENAVVPAFADYVRRELGYQSERVYYSSGGGIGKWQGTRRADPEMENTFARSPHTRLFVAEGYFDLATIYYGFEWTLAHLHISPQVRSHNIRVERYPSGHMIYTDAAALRQLSKDLHGWL